MEKIKVYDQFNRPPFEGEINSGEVLVETEGYVPSNVLIENMIYAGQRLDYSRSDYYEYQNGEEVDEGYINPVLDKRLDIVDRENYIRALNGRIAEQKALFMKEQAEREAKLKAQAGKVDNGTSGLSEPDSKDS